MSNSKRGEKKSDLGSLRVEIALTTCTHRFRWLVWWKLSVPRLTTESINDMNNEMFKEALSNQSGVRKYFYGSIMIGDWSGGNFQSHDWPRNQSMTWITKCLKKLYQTNLESENIFMAQLPPVIFFYKICND